MDDKKIILILLAAVAVPLIVWFFIRLKAAQDEIKAIIAERFSGKTIRLQDPLALHVAQESRGYSQKRGNGNLILTDEELFFAMPCPKTFFSIPTNKIGKIERVSRMGGKCIMKPLLKVHFTTERGEADALGFHVKELDRWEKELAERCQSN